MDSILLVLLTTQLDNGTSVEGICPREPVHYNCSVHADVPLELTWTVTFHHQMPITISYNGSYDINNTHTFSNGIRSALTRYFPYEYVESTLSFELSVHDIVPAVKCTISDLPAVEVNLVAYKGKNVATMVSSGGKLPP
jgi:hypothetical protein